MVGFRTYRGRQLRFDEELSDGFRWNQTNQQLVIRPLKQRHALVFRLCPKICPSIEYPINGRRGRSGNLRSCKPMTFRFHLQQSFIGEIQIIHPEHPIQRTDELTGSPRMNAQCASRRSDGEPGPWLSRRHCDGQFRREPTDHLHLLVQFGA